jgi:hypothetical protein
MAPVWHTGASARTPLGLSYRCCCQFAWQFSHR